VKASSILQATASRVGDVPKKREHEVELVWMSTPRPKARRCTTTKQRKDRQTVTTVRYVVNKSSLMSLKDWDLANNSQGLAKLQHKMWQTVRREDTMVGSGCGGSRRSLMRLPHSC